VSAPRTVPELLMTRIAATPQAVAWQHRQGGAWRDVTWEAFGARVRAIASGLRELGIARGDRVAILCGTRLAWIEVDLGALCAGAAVTTIYPSSTAEECRFLLQDCGARAIFVEDPRQLSKILEVWHDLPDLERAVLIDGEPPDARATTLDALADRGERADAADPGAFEERVAAIAPEDLATMIYTSGTTGRPKGVRLTHDCWIATTAAAEEVVRPSLRGDDSQYLFLPLSHSFGKVLELAAIQIGLPTAVDGDLAYLVTGLREVRPTFCGGVPRVFEKVHAKIHAQARERGAIAARLLRWAERIGVAHARRRLAGEPISPWLALRFAVADRIVFRKVNHGFGGRVRCFVSGGAPIAPDLAAFFHAAGLPVLEGYGLTESSAASVMNRLDDLKLGTVGKPNPGVELRIADDGEVLLRGRGIMAGYHGLPDETARALDAEGWLHTGDIGQLDADGFLTITGRKKELIITAGGKNIAPARFENLLKSRCHLVSQVLMHGDRRPYCVALITLDPEAARELAPEGASDDDIARSPAVRAAVEAAVAEVNRELPSFETVKRFALLPRDFSVESGELTPSLKVRRAVVAQRHRATLDALYDAPASAAAASAEPMR